MPRAVERRRRMPAVQPARPSVLQRYPQLDRRFEAIVVDREAVRPDAGDAALVHRLIIDLGAHGMETLAVEDADADELFAGLWRRGIPSSLVLVVGHPFAAGSAPDNAPVVDAAPPLQVEILRDQLYRRKRRDVPEVDDDPAWSVTVDGLDPKLERVHETLLTLADGRIGTSGSPVGAHPAARPRVLASGVYDGTGPETDLLLCPVWTRLDGPLPPELPLRRRLDLHTGLLRQEVDGPADGVTALLFASAARPGVAALRAQGADELLRSDRPLVSESGDSRSGYADGRFWMRQDASEGGVVAAAVETRSSHRIERVAAYEAVSEGTPETAAALARLDSAREVGFERLLTEHRRAWARRWEEADIRIAGDDELQRSVRFALFHLMGSVAEEGEAAVGARGLSGPAYRGHVFWDSDVFVLPFLTATHPAAARAMLEYRIRRLEDARAAARELGRSGARFPWESARDGFDVTPSHAHDSSGRTVPIRTGELEEHITADLAWAAAFYIDWTGDEAFANGPGRTLLVETARYWASRIRVDNHGPAHIFGVIGPDEYHEPVDDNAYTNVMVRWNLRRAAAACSGAPGDVTTQESQRWLWLADALVDGYDSATGVYEQFAGFNELEPLIIADTASRRPVAADLLLGKERVAGAQVLKQADVLMLHHLVPGEVASGSLVPNLEFYEPRTAHGSSLSPAIHAGLFARAGRLGHAAEILRLASRIDLDDLTGTTAGGLHLATMGGLWQALAFGFAGLRASEDGVLQIDPLLPADWQAMELRCLFRGHRVRLKVERDLVTVGADAGVRISIVEKAGRGIAYAPVNEGGGDA